jgi:ferredoxin--NADP+ reductase
VPGADIEVLLEEVELDPLSQAELEEGEDRTIAKKVEILQELARRKPAGKPKKLTIRFLVSPVELMADHTGSVAGMRLVCNELYRDKNGKLRPKPTDQYEELPVQLVFRSVGYHGVPLDGLPFDDGWGVVPNEKGRVVDPEGGTPELGVYVSGWIKRGPTGVIGTNKPDAAETVKTMLGDLAEQRILRPIFVDRGAIERLLADRQPTYVSFADWQRLNEQEVGRGKLQGRPRVKFTSVADMLEALGKGQKGGGQ